MSTKNLTRRPTIGVAFTVISAQANAYWPAFVIRTHDERTSVGLTWANTLNERSRNGRDTT